jgi:hypothetical protein
MMKREPLKYHGATVCGFFIHIWLSLAARAPPPVCGVGGELMGTYR